MAFWIKVIRLHFLYKPERKLDASCCVRNICLVKCFAGVPVSKAFLILLQTYLNFDQL